MAGEQLERSILESKERDELQAIAAAMSLKPSSRTKKSDIIDLILGATKIRRERQRNLERGSAPAVSMTDVDAIADEPIIAHAPSSAEKSAAAASPGAETVATSSDGQDAQAFDASGQGVVIDLEGATTNGNGNGRPCRCG